MIVVDEPNETHKNSFLPLDDTRGLESDFGDVLEPHKYIYEQQRLTSVKEISAV